MMRVIAVAAVATACGDDGGPPGMLQIGVHDEQTDAFVPLTDGQALPVVLGANGLNMIVPSLRAADADPRGPDPSVTVSVGGILMAAVLKGERVDMTDDGQGFVLWDLRVPFQTELCCYNCLDGTIFARLDDRSGHAFESSVRVRLSRNDTCPDTTVCCGDAKACPDPAITQLCE